jgi:hypothetical protein
VLEQQGKSEAAERAYRFTLPHTQDESSCDTSPSLITLVLLHAVSKDLRHAIEIKAWYSLVMAVAQGGD